MKAVVCSEVNGHLACYRLSSDGGKRGRVNASVSSCADAGSGGGAVGPEAENAQDPGDPARKRQARQDQLGPEQGWGTPGREFSRPGGSRVTQSSGTPAAVLRKDPLARISGGTCQRNPTPGQEAKEADGGRPRV